MSLGVTEKYRYTRYFGTYSEIHEPTPNVTHWGATEFTITILRKVLDICLWDSAYRAFSPTGKLRGLELQTFHSILASIIILI